MRRLLAALCAALLLALTACTPRSQTPERHELTYLDVFDTVTTLRQDALKGLISKESPVGQALMGRRTGERVEVAVSPEMKYTLEIRKIEKGSDDESLDISSY